MNELTLGVDLGGTKVEVAVVESDGRIAETTREETRTEGGADAVKDQVCRLVENLTAIRRDAVLVGIGVGVAGQVEAETGVVRGAPNLGWHDYPLRQQLVEVFDLPCLVDNDVRMAAYGEWKQGAGQGVDDLICIFVGTGIGSGIVTDGKLLSGFANTAGEVGHMTIALNGRECRCPNSGCMEAYAGGWAIERNAREAISESKSAGAAILAKAGGDVKGVTAEAVAEAALDGDTLALEIFAEAAKALVTGCISLVNITSPRRLILGGGVIEGYSKLIDEVKEGVMKRALPAAAEGVEVLGAELGDKSGVCGAALAIRDMLARKEQDNEPTR